MAEILVKAFDSVHADPEKLERGGTPKGSIVDVFENGHVYGRKMGLPYFVHVKCPAVTVAQVQQYVSEWHLDLTHEVLTENAQGYRVKLTLSPIPSTGLSDVLKERIHRFLTNKLNAQLYEYSGGNSATYDIPKPLAQPMAEIRQMIADEMRYFSKRRYLFDPSDVDTVIANGGEVTVTPAVLLAKLIDRAAL